MPEGYDHDDVHWQDTKTGKITGYGFLTKDDEVIGLIRCPVCETENYALNVGSGVCYQCGFDSNK